jgi:amino acid transporter
MTLAMANDGLLFKYLSRIHERTKTPHFALLTSIVISLILTVVFDIENLIGFANITGFLNYSIIAAALLVVRYFHDDVNHDNEFHSDELHNAEVSFLSQDLNRENNTILNKIQNNLAIYAFFQKKQNALIIILVIFFLDILLCGIINYYNNYHLFFLIVLFVANVLLTIILGLFKQVNQASVSFKVKCLI